tara:strand:- start:6746 stop:7417 length:672 start_codon:yes stop_codon:yes gene_type:complete
MEPSDKIIKFLTGLSTSSTFDDHGFVVADDMQFDYTAGLDSTDILDAEFSYERADVSIDQLTVGIGKTTFTLDSDISFGDGDYSDRHGATVPLYFDEGPDISISSATSYTGPATSGMGKSSNIDYDDREKKALQYKFGGLEYSSIPTTPTGVSHLDHVIDTKIKTYTSDLAMTITTRENIPNVIRVDKDLGTFETLQDETSTTGTTNLNIDTTLTTTITSTTY